jgi:hypothetical protein
MPIAWRALPILVVALVPVPPALAQTDEIQVYDGVLAAPGTFSLTLHTNFTPQGISTPSFPGALIADKSLNGVPEWAYGVKPWFEAGLYLPLYSIGKIGTARRVTVDGAKLRLLFAAPEADERRFFYGVNFELSYNADHWDPKRFTSEVRPIVGWHLGSWDLIGNPIFDTSYDGLRNLIFAPATRLAYKPSEGWALAVEEYDEFGPIQQFYSGSEQTHQLYAVFDRTIRSLQIEGGIGWGLTAASDRLTLKLILERELK